MYCQQPQRDPRSKSKQRKLNAVLYETVCDAILRLCDISKIQIGIVQLKVSCNNMRSYSKLYQHWDSDKLKITESHTPVKSTR